MKHKAVKPVKKTNSGVSSYTVEPVFGKGAVRDYLITGVGVTNKKRYTKQDFALIAILVIVGCFIRLAKLSIPNSVVFDEVHFGGFARKYILGTFFMDVHPPLAKMLYAAVAAIGGFNGKFTFQSIGDHFKETPYVLMREFPAICGVGVVVLSYLTLRESNVRPWICFITSSLLLFENANITISRYILLDSPLLFFIAAAVYSFQKLQNIEAFSYLWIKSLVVTGIALGLALSSKWVGLFTIAYIGALNIWQMWLLIGDLTVPVKKIWTHFFVRGFVLLGVPIVLYLSFFAIHFRLLTKEGDGGAFMSSAFRAGLEGNRIPTNITSQVGLGSVITLRHVDTQGGYLHSHDHFYPAGSKQQQVTLYPHLDSNNKWLIEPFNGTIYNDTFVPLINGMKIRLKHVNSERRLHSHDEKAPVSERDWQKEVSAYGYEGFTGDANDDWQVEIVQHKTKDPNAKVFVQAIGTIFRLRHAMTGNYLFSSEVKLPDWGFGQQEVTSASQGRRSLSYWYIEQNENAILPAEQHKIINYPKLTLWEKIAESHKKMWKINSGLTDHHHWQSDPREWPFLLRGINYWSKEHRQVYLLGNAVTWWGATLAVFSFIAYTIITLSRCALGRPVPTNKEVFNFNMQNLNYVVGWSLHYLPFFVMGRQLFLHHYLPALYFGILSIGQFFELFVGYFASKSKIVQQVVYSLIAGYLVLSIVFYMNYSPLIYASPWTKASCEISKPFKGWDYDCNNFYKNLAQYDLPEVIVSSSSAKKTVPAEAKQTPKAEKKLAQVEQHLESPPAEKKEIPKVEQQLAPPEVKAETPEAKNVEKPILEEIPSDEKSSSGKVEKRDEVVEPVQAAGESVIVEEGVLENFV
ncbi:PMT1 [Candida oxycetoniae]|uniref:Dolichyl-phosphate-mannose--protein mannosyltransferase n=1 Tax=Candida oxycetoniae TaxID=497107 RepID=A0AAI9WY29_9ASCO|nr:PMT1 [Candida oxycetoniae]KAI3404605.1 PMT1 [Candida oxycetoniae]